MKHQTPSESSVDAKDAVETRELVPANREVPREKRSKSLEESVQYFVQLTSQLSKDFPGQQNLFYFLAYPWVTDAGDNAEVKAVLEQRQKEIGSRGFDGVQVKNRLDQILAEDSHLRDCCANSSFLAYYLDHAFVGLAAGFGDVFKPEMYAWLFNTFLKTTYSEPFKKQAVSHIFNFDADSDRLDFEGFRIVKLDAATVSRMLGEPTFPSFIHPPGVGDYFVVTEEGGPSDDLIRWLYEEKNKAVDFAQVLQYFKDGIVHVDYTVPHFLPLWVNDIRKRGIFFIGNPHRESYALGKKPFRINENEVEHLRKWLRVVGEPAISEALNDERNRVRQLLLRAGTYYEHHHQQSDSVAKLIDLAIALEALFTPSDKGELTYRIAHTVSCLLGANSDERKALFKFVKDIYGKRSALFHGQYDVDAYHDGTLVTEEEVEKLASIIRRSILRLAVLYIRGLNNLDQLRTRLSDSMLDPDQAREVQSASEPESFIAGMLRRSDN